MSLSYSCCNYLTFSVELLLLTLTPPMHGIGVGDGITKNRIDASGNKVIGVLLVRRIMGIGTRTSEWRWHAKDGNRLTGKDGRHGLSIIRGSVQPLVVTVVPRASLLPCRSASFEVSTN